MNSSKIIVYGADWCSDCIRTKFYLDSKKIPYVYINIDNDKKSAEKVEKMNNGYKSIPTIAFPNGTIIVEPTNKELKTAIDKNYQI